jgi:hypothetical protein
VRDPEVIRRGVAACRETLADTGLVLVQDATLPSITTIVTGTPVRGSWWAHEQAHSIFDVLETLEPDTTVAKLLARKQTLVDRRLWAALAAVGGEGAEWQLAGLSADAHAVFGAVVGEDAPVRVDRLALPDRTTRADVVRELEHRLLLHTEEIHTGSGRHVKALQSWAGWARDRGLRGPDPDPPEARAAFEAAVARVAPERVDQLLPWPPGLTS